MLTLLSLAAGSGPSVEQSCNAIAEDDESGADNLTAAGTQLQQVTAEVMTEGSWSGDDSEVERVSARLTTIADDAPASIGEPLVMLVEVLGEARETSRSDESLDGLTAHIEGVTQLVERGIKAIEEVQAACPELKP